MLDMLQVQDAWPCAFSPSSDPNDQFNGKGWTWAFHTKTATHPDAGQAKEDGDTEDPSPQRSQKEDRLRPYLSSHGPRLSKCFTHGLANSDHGAVIVELPPHPHPTGPGLPLDTSANIFPAM